MPTPSNIDDLKDLIVEKLFDNSSGLIEEHTVRETLIALSMFFDTKLGLVSPTMTEDQTRLMENLLNLKTSNFIGTISPATSIPATGDIFGIAEAGTYPNAGGLVVPPDYIGFLSKVGSEWSLAKVKMPNNAAEKVFNPLDDEKPSTMKATSDWFAINKEKWQDVQRTSSLISIDYKNGENVKLNGLLNSDTITITNMANKSTLCLYVECVQKINSLNIDRVIWQNGEFGQMEIGKSYFIIISTFNGGTTKIGSLIGSWQSTVYKAFDSFSIDGNPAIDEKGNNYLKSNGDTFIKSNGYLQLQTKTTGYPSLYTELGTSNFTAVAKLDANAINVDLVVNVRQLTNGLTFYFIAIIPNKICVFGYVLNGSWVNNQSQSVSVPNIDLNNYELSIKRTDNVLEFYVDGTKVGQQIDGQVGGNLWQNYGVMIPSTTNKVKEIFCI